MKVTCNSNTKEQKVEEGTAAPPIQPIRMHRLQYEEFKPKTLIENVSYMLIRPPKLLYDPKILEPVSVSCRHKHQVHHIPFELSLYLPKRHKPRYVILYLHCNSSNRMEGSTMVRFLPDDVGLACFDFAGCGNRKGQWVTLGVEEGIEADIAARYLKDKGFHQLVGWGRSMGAVSLLMSSECDIMVVDSPFCSLSRLCKQSGQHVPYLPGCLFHCIFPCVFCCVKRDITKKTQQNIIEILDLESRVEELDSHKSIMFLSGDNDSMIDKSHSEQLYKRFKGHKEILIFQGTHNSVRSHDVLHKVFVFIEQSLQVGNLVDQLRNSANLEEKSKKKPNVTVQMVQVQHGTTTENSMVPFNNATESPEPRAQSPVVQTTEQNITPIVLRKSHNRSPLPSLQRLPNLPALPTFGSIQKPSEISLSMNDVEIHKSLQRKDDLRH